MNAKQIKAYIKTLERLSGKTRLTDRDQAEVQAMLASLRAQLKEASDAN